MEATRYPRAPVAQDDDHSRTLVQLSPDVMYELSVDGEFTSLSPAFTAITGWEVGEWLGKPFARLIHPDDLPLAMEKFQQTMRGEVPAPHEIRILSRSGEYLVGDIRGTPVFENGRVAGGIGVARDVTARVRMRQELQESRDQLDVILQSVDDGITVQRPDGQIIYANAIAARMTGLSSTDALVQKTAQDISQRFEILDEQGRRLPLEDLPNRRALERHESGEALIRYRALDNLDVFWSRLKSRPIFDERGQLRFVVNIFQDVTERHRLEEVQARIAAIVQSSEDAIIGKDLEGIVLSWNRGAERLYGYSSDEMVGKSLAVIVPPERPDELPGIMSRLKRGERIERFETVRLRKDGSRLDVWLSISPIQDSTGQIIGAATIARDVSEAKRAEKERAALLAREKEARGRAEAAGERLEFLARASDILSSSLDYETTLANLARLAVPALGDWCLMEIVEDDGSVRRIALTHPDPEKEALARELEGKYPRSTDRGVSLVVRTGQSQLVPEITDEMLVASARDEEHLRVMRGLGFVSAIVVPLSARERVLGAITLISAESGKRYGPDDLELLEDLGRRAAVAVDNARLYEDAQAALRLREEFLSIASHELKTPLTSLQLQIQILDRFTRQSVASSLSPERAGTLLDGAERQIKRLAKLTNDLLDVSRIAAGHLDLEPAVVELGEVVEDVVERFHEEAAAAGSVIRLEAQSDLVGRWDPFRLDQVVTNLFSNAIKYGDGKPIDVRVFAGDSEARVSVQDHGAGIAPENLERIFDRFERTTSALSRGGLGLGLYIAKQIIDAQGGTIRVESEINKGSTFTVSLPYDP